MFTVQMLNVAVCLKVFIIIGKILIDNGTLNDLFMHDVLFYKRFLFSDIYPDFYI